MSVSVVRRAEKRGGSATTDCGASWTWKPTNVVMLLTHVLNELFMIVDVFVRVLAEIITYRLLFSINWDWNLSYV